MEQPKQVETKIQAKQTRYLLSWILKAFGYIPTKDKDQYLFSLGYNLDMVILGKTIELLGSQKDYAGLQVMEGILKSNLEKLMIIKKEVNTEFFKRDVELNPVLGQTMDDMLKKLNNQPTDVVAKPKTRPRF